MARNKGGREKKNMAPKSSHTLSHSVSLCHTSHTRAPARARPAPAGTWHAPAAEARHARDHVTPLKWFRFSVPVTLVRHLVCRRPRPVDGGAAVVVVAIFVAAVVTIGAAVGIVAVVVPIAAAVVVVTVVVAVFVAIVAAVAAGVAFLFVYLHTSLVGVFVFFLFLFLLCIRLVLIPVLSLGVGVDGFINGSILIL